MKKEIKVFDNELKDISKEMVKDDEYFICRDEKDWAIINTNYFKICITSSSLSTAIKTAKLLIEDKLYVKKSDIEGIEGLENVIVENGLQIK